MSANSDLATFRLDSSLTGLELLQRWISQGLVAGLNGRLQTRPIEATAGRVRFACQIDEGHGNFVGLVHGGVAAALVDIAGGAAAMTLLKAGETLLTADLAMRFLNPAPLSGGDLIAEAVVSYQDGRRIVADVQVATGDVVMAQGSVSISIRRPQAKAA